MTCNLQVIGKRNIRKVQASKISLHHSVGMRDGVTVRGHYVHSLLSVLHAMVGGKGAVPLVVTLTGNGFSLTFLQATSTTAVVAKTHKTRTPACTGAEQMCE